jgi:hypothetical protein
VQWKRTNPKLGFVLAMQHARALGKKAPNPPRPLPRARPRRRANERPLRLARSGGQRPRRRRNCTGRGGRHRRSATGVRGGHEVGWQHEAAAHPLAVVGEVGGDGYGRTDCGDVAVERLVHGGRRPVWERWEMLLHRGSLGVRRCPTPRTPIPSPPRPAGRSLTPFDRRHIEAADDSEVRRRHPKECIRGLGAAPPRE